MNHSTALASIVLVLCACTTAPEKSATSPEPAPAPKAQPAEVSQAPESALQRQERQMQELSAKSIYFAANSHAVSPEYQALVQDVAGFLKSAPQISLTLLGNSDERGRGSRVAASKRAQSVKRALTALGVADDQVQVVSQGKDKPRAACHEEKCWAQNRRVDFEFRSPTPK